MTVNMVVPTSGSLLRICGRMNLFFSGLLDFYVLTRDRGIPVHPEIYLRYGDHIFLAIGYDPGQVMLRPVYLSYLATIDIILRRGDAEHVGQQLQGNKALIIPEFPKLEGIDMRYFPGLFTGNIKNARNGQSMNDHPAAQVRKIELF